MLTYSAAALKFPSLHVSSAVDVKQGGGSSTSAVYTELVQCGSLRMQLNLEARRDTHTHSQFLFRHQSADLVKAAGFQGRARGDFNL